MPTLVFLSSCYLRQLASAEKIVQANENITLNPDDFQAFLTALDAQPEPNLAFQNAFKRHSEQVSY